MTTEQILARLNQGEDIENIAQEFTKALNEAKSIQEKKEKEKDAKLASATKANQALKEYFNAYVPNLVWDLTDEEFAETLDLLGEGETSFFQELENFISLFGKLLY